MGVLETIAEILESEDMRYRTFQGDEGKGIRLGLGFIHNPHRWEISRKSMDSVVRVVERLMERGILDREGQVLVEDVLGGYPKTALEQYDTKRQRVPRSEHRYVGVRALRTSQDFADLNLRIKKGTGHFDYRYFNYQGEEYKYSAFKGQPVIRLFSLLSKDPIPLIFAGDVENTEALRIAYEKDSESDEVKRLVEEGRDHYMSQLFSPGPRFQILVAGAEDFARGEDSRPYNKEGMSYIFAEHKDIDTLRSKGKLSNPQGK